MCMGPCCRSMDPAAGAPLHPAGETPSLSTAGLGQENRQPLLQKGQPLLTGPMQQIREQTPLCPSLSKPRTETPRRKHREVSHVSWGLTENASQSQAATQPEPALSRQDAVGKIPHGLCNRKEWTPGQGLWRTPVLGPRFLHAGLNGRGSRAGNATQPLEGPTSRETTGEICVALSQAGPSRDLLSWAPCKRRLRHTGACRSPT